MNYSIIQEVGYVKDMTNSVIEIIPVVPFGVSLLTAIGKISARKKQQEGRNVEHYQYNSLPSTKFRKKSSIIQNTATMCVCKSKQCLTDSTREINWN